VFSDFDELGRVVGSVAKVYEKQQIMRIVYCGSGEFGLPSLEAIVASEHNLCLVLTQPPHPAGRGRKSKPTAVASWAEKNTVSYHETDNINSPDMLGKIADFKPDLLVVIAFGQKIGDELICPNIGEPPP